MLHDDGMGSGWKTIAVVCLTMLAGCGGSEDTGPKDWPAEYPPASVLAETGIRRDTFQVAGVVPPPNPTTGAATPAELNATVVVRYRKDADPPAAASAIVLLMPGTNAGAGGFDPLARHLVRRSIAAGRPIEIWALDRRANLLEDTRGLDAAEAAENAEIAQRWYFETDTIAGQGFAAFKNAGELGFESEWGLATHIGDVMKVLEKIPAAERKQRVFLGGHSLGGIFSEAFAAWRFEDGTRGSEQLAGVILLDGAMWPEPLTEDDYLNRGFGRANDAPGLKKVRSDAPIFELPLIGVAAHARLEVLALRALFDPARVMIDDGRDEMLKLLLLLGSGVPKLTNEAAFGLATDAEYSATGAANIGKAAGGAFESYLNPLVNKMLEHPTDLAATYTWIGGDATTPPEPSRLATLARSMTSGRVNTTEWYFPHRIRLDLRALGPGNAEGDYLSGFGIRAFDRGLDDAPFIAVHAKEDLTWVTKSRQLVAQTVGPGRPRAGATRDTPEGYEIVEANLEHFEVLVAEDGPLNPVPAKLDAFIAANTAPGSVAIPRIE